MDGKWMVYDGFMGRSTINWRFSIAIVEYPQFMAIWDKKSTKFGDHITVTALKICRTVGKL